ncbi:hypothetical protein EJ04DRAFT_512871 [Polyplosphaeria fusca]|uniref:Uncharacterized protein n=1 Tax=Polyplosphaeria fusca TaxID=682080 RepID=A0A9P4QZC6_9PLEO|nr:hypothetical protein EJ04DRAFT_512871 [Polyplosphaeria fusca]
MNGRTAVITAIAITVLGSFYLVYSPSLAKSSMSKSSAAAQVPLEFKLSQISKSPPSLLVTVKNNSPSSTFTFLKWGTPLDVQALNLGVFKLTHADSGEEVPVDKLMINRKMPPSRDDLQEVAPGTEHSTEVVFDRPWMPSTKPASYNVGVQGDFKGVWEKSASNVKEEELDAYTDGPLNSHAFACEETLLAVE